MAPSASFLAQPAPPPAREGFDGLRTFLLAPRACVPFTAIQAGREMVIARFADKKKTVHPFP